ncbi:MAG: dipeptidase PepV [Firmicutes bacterium]|nr:dipeptidase PepV [Bacillota bacterium]
MEFLNRIDQYREEMICSLQELIAIPSVEGPAKDGAPFGVAVKQAYDYMMAKAKAEGFDTFDADGYGGHMEFGGWIFDEEGDPIGRNDEAMGILVHLDVVPPGERWTHEPFGGEIEDGCLYGRGSKDDKGPAIMAFYAMKALKDSGFQPEKRVRLVLGLDEETGWEGMHYYLKKTAAPTFSVSPDAEFPLIHGEMGLLIFQLARKFRKYTGKGMILRSITGGNAPNMVADWAKALVRADSYDLLRALADTYRRETGRRINLKGRGKSMEILAQGVSAHGSTPEKGVNAISVLMDFLGRLDFVNHDQMDFIKFYNDKIGFELDGQSLGCGLSDSLSRPLILNVGQIQMDEEAALLTINIRYPLTCTEEQVFDGMEAVRNAYDLGLVKMEHKAPLYVPKDDPMVETLMDVYRRHSGDTESQPLIIGGGTYARAVPNAVAFGPAFPGDPETEHQAEECVPLESLFKAARIYAEAIYLLTKGPDEEEFC